MNGRTGPKSRRVTALMTLVAFVGGFTTVAAASRGSGPAVPAQVAAERALVSRMVAEPGLSLAAEDTGAPLEFLEGAAFVSLPGTATRIRVPAVGIDTEVRSVGYVFRNGRLEYDTPTVGAGHYVGTGDPGRGGNVVIGGHVSLRGSAGAFRALPGIAVGETIEVFSGGQAYRYEVREVRLVAPDATEVMEPTQDATLTLITCSNDNAHAKRIVVVGKLV